MPTVAQTLPLFPDETTAFRGYPDWSPSELMEKGGRMLTVGPRANMAWRSDDAPYLDFPLDTYAEPWVREIVVAGGNQVAKTTFYENCFAYSARYQPSTAMMVLQDEDTCDTRMRDNIRPMIEGSPFLAEIRSDYGHDEGLGRVRFANGHTLYTGAGTSQASTETWTIEYLYCDEPDFWPEKTGDLDRIRKRVVAFPHTHKIVIVCKPLAEHGPTWTAFQAADVRYYPHPTCLACDKPFRLTWDRVRWPDKSRAAIRRNRLARLVCPHCGHEHDDRAKDDAVRYACARGTFWQPDQQVDRPWTVAFHLPSMISQFVSLSVLAYEWLGANEQKHFGNIEPLKTFTTARLAEPWIEHHAPRDVDQIYARAVPRPRGLVPAGALALCAGVDTQDNGLYYVIAAATAPKPRSLSLHMIREGFVPRETDTDDDFDELAAILWDDTYLDAHDQPYVLALAHQDAMGHRTHAVYDFAAGHPGRLYPTKGNQRQSAPHYLSTITKYPNSNRAIKGGVQLRNLNVTYYQDQLNGKLRVPPGDPGSIDFHADITPATGKDFADQMTVCYRDDDGIWIHPPGKAEHYWSCWTYLLAAFDVLGVRFWAPPKQQPAATPAAPIKPKRPKSKRPNLW